MSEEDNKQRAANDHTSGATTSTLERLRQAAERRRAWAAEREAAEAEPALTEDPEVLAAKARALEVQIESFGALNSRLEISVKEGEVARTRLEARVQELELALAERDSDYEGAIEAQESMLEELEIRTKERDQLQARLAASDKEKAVQTQRARAGEERVTTLEASDTRLREELSNTSKSLVNTQAKLTEVTEGYDRLQRQMSELGEAHEAELSQELAKRESELVLVKRERAELEQSAAAERAHVEEELASAFEAAREAQRETQELADAMEELREHAGAALHEQELRFAERTQERDEAGASAATLRNELELERERVASLRSDIKALHGAVEEQLDQEEATHDRELELSDRIAELQQQVQSFTSLNSKLQITLDTLVKERDEIGKDSEFVLNELDRTQTRLGELETRNEQLIEENRGLLMEADTLRRSAAETGEGTPVATPAPSIDDAKLRQYEAEMLMARDIISGLEEQCSRNEHTIATLRAELKKTTTGSSGDGGRGRPKVRQPRRRGAAEARKDAKDPVEAVSA